MNCLNVAVWVSVELHQCSEQEGCQRTAQQLNTSLTLPVPPLSDEIESKAHPLLNSFRLNDHYWKVGTRDTTITSTNKHDSPLLIPGKKLSSYVINYHYY